MIEIYHFFDKNVNISAILIYYFPVWLKVSERQQSQTETSTTPQLNEPTEQAEPDQQTSTNEVTEVQDEEPYDSDEVRFSQVDSNSSDESTVYETVETRIKSTRRNEAKGKRICKAVSQVSTLPTKEEFVKAIRSKNIMNLINKAKASAKSSATKNGSENIATSSKVMETATEKVATPVNNMNGASMNSDDEYFLDENVSLAPPVLSERQIREKVLMEKLNDPTNDEILEVTESCFESPTNSAKKKKKRGEIFLIVILFEILSMKFPWK